MATLSTGYPTLLDLAKMSDANGNVQTDIVEILNQVSDILDDMVWQEGNLPTGHRTTIRSGLPTPTWRKMYGGVIPNKGTTVQVTDTCGMLEAYAEVDKALADLNGNAAKFRLNEDRAHVEGIHEELATSLFFADETVTSEKFTGFAPRFNSSTALNGENIIKGGGSGTDNTSIWLVVWGPLTVHGIIPKGSIAGLQQEDKGQVTVESAPDGSGGRYEAYRTHYRFDAGLTVRDWRYVVRICNIDKSDLKLDYSTGANLVNLMVQAEELIPNLNAGRAAFYVSRNIRSFLRQQMLYSIRNSSLTLENMAGKQVLMFDGIPVRRVDALAADEALVS